MAPRSRTTARLLPWLILGPLLIIAGAFLGRLYPELVGRGKAPAWTEPRAVTQRTDPQDLGGTLPSLAPLLDEVRAGVVSITTLRTRNRPADMAAPPRVAADERMRAPTEELNGFGIVRGTGFVVHEDGLIVTTHHVIADYASIRVDLADRRTFTAKVVGEDPISDLALLQLQPPSGDAQNKIVGLKALHLGDSSRVRQGDWVMSLGNPFEFHESLSVGLITFVGRHLTEEGVHVTNAYLQFSAPVNPGESGAPLFDMAGNVIGVTRRTLTAGRGISFAVPSKVVRELLAAVERGDRHVRRGYVGMEFRAPARPEELRGLVVDGGGAEVTRVIKGHPADSAGVRVGDVILDFDGEPVSDAADLYAKITESRPGQDKQLSVLRRGRVLPPLAVTVGEVGKTALD